MACRSRSGLFPQDADKGLPALARDARESFEFFSDRIGPFAYGKLAHVEAAGMGGGMEHVSNIFYGEKGVAAGNAPVVHETAHQWFGDAVTESDWNDVWLSEGFATYFALLYTEYARRPRCVRRRPAPQPRAVLRLEKSLPNTPVVHVNFNEASTEPNNRLVYEKGAWTLHMLRDQVGTDTFWRGIRLYYQRYMNGLASTADLRRAMEEVSGQDLRVVLRSVADPERRSTGVGQLALRRRGQAGRRNGRPDTVRRAVPISARHRRLADAGLSGRDPPGPGDRPRVDGHDSFRDRTSIGRARSGRMAAGRVRIFSKGS